MTIKNPVMLNVNDLIKSITENDKIFLDRGAAIGKFPDSDLDVLYRILTKEYIRLLDDDLRQRLTGRTLRELLNATSRGTKSSMIGDRECLAKLICAPVPKDDDNGFAQIRKALSTFETIFSRNNIKPSFSLADIPLVYKFMLEEPVCPTDWITSHSQPRIIKELNKLDSQLDSIRKYILYLYGKKVYPQFFWWLFLFALFQGEIVRFLPYIEKTQYQDVVDYLELKDKKLLEIRRKSLIPVSEDDFFDIRRKLVSTAKGHLILMGPSLRDAFRSDHSNRIIEELQDALSRKNKTLTKVSLLLTDPVVFNSEQVCSEPKKDIDGTITALQDQFYPLFKGNKVELCIYFLPFLQIDHAVITEEFMLFRSNKLWNNQRRFKGAFTMHVADFYAPGESEYLAQVDYINVIMANSTVIFPDVDIDDAVRDSNDARTYHKKWREFLRDNNYNYIYLNKVYEKQMHSYVCNTWRKASDSGYLLTPGGSIKSMEDFYRAENLLNDRTQTVLLPYLKETEAMFTEAIKKHDRNEESFCHLYPSLDLGFPNNVRRLAGGFATGMLVTWNCGTEIVPIDATVNVCTSSVFKLDHPVNPAWLVDQKLFHEAMEQYEKDAKELGYSYSFCSGNHFLLIAKDKDTGEQYLVLHSSANELKNSYMGLYPVEGNWYSDNIKYINGENDRYFRYLKDEDARYFIRMAKNFQKYNEQIHQWIAQQINGGRFKNDEKWMAHHYYMPTDQSIAIGTFAEPPGTQVPIFSAHKKPVYIFEIGKRNFQIDLGGQKGKVCLVPHGWGQKIDGIEAISVRDDQLVLRVNGQEYPTRISSHEHIRCDQKQIRDFKDGDDFLQTGHGYIQGRFVKELIPCIEYSRNTVDVKR